MKWIIVTRVHSLYCTVFKIQPITNMSRWLTFQGHPRTNRMVPNETSYMIFYPGVIVTICFSCTDLEIDPYIQLKICNKFGRICQCYQVETSYKYDFLSIINSNYVVILNRYGDIGHWESVWPWLTIQGHSRSKTMVPNGTSYMTSYQSSIVTLWLSWIDLEI